MGGELSLYSFENADGDQEGTYTTMDWQEAKEYAQRFNLRVIENVYEWSEALPVDGGDFTEKGDDA